MVGYFIIWCKLVGAFSWSTELDQERTLGELHTSLLFVEIRKDQLIQNSLYPADKIWTNWEQYQRVPPSFPVFPVVLCG